MNAAQFFSFLAGQGLRGTTRGGRTLNVAFLSRNECRSKSRLCSPDKKFSHTLSRCMNQLSNVSERWHTPPGQVFKTFSTSARWRYRSSSVGQPCSYMHPSYFFRPSSRHRGLSLLSQMHWQAPSLNQQVRCLSITTQCNMLDDVTPAYLSIKPLVISTKRNVGRSSRHNDVDDNTINIMHARKRVRERTKYFLKGRVSRLNTSFSKQNFKRLQDKLGGTKSSKEDVRTIPNLLTTLRMASAPVLAYLVVNESFGLACSLFVLAGLTDMLDGYIARNYKNQRTALGTALDPLADKLLVSFLTISLTSVGLIPVPVTALIVGRDVGLIAATFYVRYISLAPPKTLSRYFDVSHVTAKLYPSTISKVNTVLQLSYVASTLASPVFDFVGHPLLQGLMWATAATTFLSGADYVLTWRRRLKIIKNN